MAHSDLKARKRSDYSFILDYRTRWSDNDMYDHMNNSVYNFLFDSAVNAFLIQHCGVDPPTSPQIGLCVHSHTDYYAPVAYPAIVEIAMRIKKLGKSSVTYETALFEKGIEKVCAVGEFIHVYVEKESRKPAKEGMPREMREALEALSKKQSKL